MRATEKKHTTNNATARIRSISRTVAQEPQTTLEIRKLAADAYSVATVYSPRYALSLRHSSLHSAG